MTRSTRRAVSAVALFSATLLTLSCDKTKPKVLTRIVVTLNTSTIQVGQQTAANAAGFDQDSGSFPLTKVTWSVATSTLASVDTTGTVTGLAAGTTEIIATVGTVSGSASLTVIPKPVASVVVTPSSASLAVGATQQLTATTLDASGATLTGRTVTWTTSDGTKATVSSTGLVTAVAAGSATITATSEGKTGVSGITVTGTGGGGGNPPPCTTLSLAVGEVHTMTAAEKASTCIAGGAAGQKLVMIPFTRSTIAASNVAVQFLGLNTSALQFTPAPPPAPAIAPRLSLTDSILIEGEKAEIEIRARERKDLAGRIHLGGSRKLGANRLTGIAATPTVGSTVTINAKAGQTTSCTDRLNVQATVVAVLPHTIVLSDNNSPAGGYTTTEMSTYGSTFDQTVWTVDTQAFGNPSDMDNNGRVAILFTPQVNAIPVTSGIVLGFFAGRVSPTT